MSLLKIYDANTSDEIQSIDDVSLIETELEKLGVKFERWQTNRVINEADSSENILKTFEKEIELFKKERGFVTADIITVSPSTLEHQDLRNKFLNEHTHSDDEARFFVGGTGLFYIHADDKVYSILCEKDDLINVPNGAKHWFDMGPEPSFTCIRFFNNEEGWVAQFTGSKLSEKYPKHNE